MDKQRIELSENFKKELKQIAIKLGACKNSRCELQNVNTLKGLYNFFCQYQDDIYGTLQDRLGEIQPDELTPERIMEYFESPFISDYDKQRIIDRFINDKRLTA